MSYSTIVVTVNGSWIMNLTALNQFAVVRGSKIFTSTTTISKLCFDPKFSIGNPLLYPYIGPCIDNVTLVKVVTPPTPTSNTTNSTNSTTNTTSTPAQNSTQTPILPVTPSSNSTNGASIPLYPPIIDINGTISPDQAIINDITFYLFCKTNR